MDFFIVQARVGGLSGDNEAEFALSEMLIEEANDIFNLISHAHYAPHRNDAYDALFAADGKFAAQCRYLENMIPEGSTAFSSRAEGDLRLVGAIALAAVLDLANFVEPSCLLATPRLKAFHDILIESAAFEGIRDMHPYFKRDIGHQH